MKKKIYIVRHGQTQFNVEKRCQGWKDSPLTQKGREQAKKVRDYFQKKGITFDHAYSSDLSRAIDTMQIIAPIQVPQYTSQALCEMSFGKYDGWKHTDIPVEDRMNFFKSVGGETYEEAIVRVFRLILHVMKQNDHHSVLFVTHGIPVSGLFRSLPRKKGILDPKDFRNGCILEYEMKGEEMMLVDFIQTEKEPFHHV